MQRGFMVCFCNATWAYISLYCPRAFTILNKSAIKTDSSKRHQTLTLLDHDAWSCFVTASQAERQFQSYLSWLKTWKKKHVGPEKGTLGRTWVYKSQQVRVKPMCHTSFLLFFLYRGGPKHCDPFDWLKPGDFRSRLSPNTVKRIHSQNSCYTKNK